MNRFKHTAVFVGNKASCTSEQLQEIIYAISSVVTGTWYCADIELIWYKDKMPEAIDKSPKKIGSTAEVINYIEADNQFLSGVFLLFDDSKKLINSMVIYTEDDYYQKYDDEILQIRLFDTSYIILSYTNRKIEKVLVEYDFKFTSNFKFFNDGTYKFTNELNLAD